MTHCSDGFVIGVSVGCCQSRFFVRHLIWFFFNILAMHQQTTQYGFCHRQHCSGTAAKYGKINIFTIGDILSKHKNIGIVAPDPRHRHTHNQQPSSVEDVSLSHSVSVRRWLARRPTQRTVHCQHAGKIQNISRAISKLKQNNKLRNGCNATIEMAQRVARLFLCRERPFRN